MTTRPARPRSSHRARPGRKRRHRRSDGGREGAPTAALPRRLRRSPGPCSSAASRSGSGRSTVSTSHFISAQAPYILAAAPLTDLHLGHLDPPRHRPRPGRALWAGSRRWHRSTRSPRCTYRSCAARRSSSRSSSSTWRCRSCGRSRRASRPSRWASSPWPSTTAPISLRSSAPASRPCRAGSVRRRRRWAWASAASCVASSCRRPCASSRRPSATSSSP